MKNLQLQAANNTETHNDSYFWDIIKDINWIDHMDDTDENPNEYVKNYLIGFLDDEFVGEFLNFVVDRKKEIQDEYRKYKKENNLPLYCSDDAFWDVTSSIIGMGEECYKLALKTPEFIDFIYDTDNYFENFEYGFDSAIYETQELMDKYNKQNSEEDDE
ncbi:MAG: DUF4240 domain-containing protein [Bacilli bacterium]|nr:DUF4240 domain-containing protein [Bacilli bacterium]